jgi:hypothetical protein
MSGGDWTGAKLDAKLGELAQATGNARPAAARPQGPVSVRAIMVKSASRALDGGLAGAAAMTLQVSALMWLRTTMNYQYRHGTSTMTALRTLYADGGVARFYRGILPALAQGPLSRFGDTAANTGVLTLMNSFDETKDLPVGAKTIVASAAAATWRIFLMPVDTLKTIMQVEGKRGLPLLGEKLKNKGPTVLYHGALAASGGTLVGHFPWFFTYNYLDANLPQPKNTKEKLIRNAAMGFVSSAISDTCSNSIRVVKTTKQTHEKSVTYPEAVREIMAKDGLAGLFGRGLKTRIVTNGLQGLLFSVLWRLIDEKLTKSRNASEKKSVAA